MIVPTPEFDPMYANDGVPFRTKMIRYIEREFGDTPRGRQWLLQNEFGEKMLPSVETNQSPTDRAKKAA